MTVVDIAWASIGAILQIIVTYVIGRHNGYWTRVDEEKSARGIK